MGREIERRFLVAGDGWRSPKPGKRYRQGYLSTDPRRTIRVRIAGNRGCITIKSLTEGLSKSEFEYALPAADAETILASICKKPLIEKTRHRIKYKGRVWEVDEFEGANAGLILAEIELQDERETFELPPWLGREVSCDARYFNSNLVDHPFAAWAAEKP